MVLLSGDQPDANKNKGRNVAVCLAATLSEQNAITGYVHV